MKNLFSKNKSEKKDKKNTKKLIFLFALSLIFFGIAIALYPHIISKYFDYRQQNLMNSWLFKNAGIAHQDIPEIPDDMEYPDIPSEADALSNDIFEEDINVFFDFNYALQMMTGILKIPSINLVSPILIGDTKDNLNIGVCEVRQSVKAGEKGNYILAGHYSRIRGRHFNRLPEIQIGASVIVQNDYASYEYIVYEILFVKPEDTWAVPINIPEKIITLITCDYSQGEPYGRVVVKGLLKK